jgi:hypothetical protein
VSTDKDGRQKAHVTMLGCCEVFIILISVEISLADSLFRAIFFTASFLRSVVNALKTSPAALRFV